jgi:hypothetical protein
MTFTMTQTAYTEFIYLLYFLRLSQQIAIILSKNYAYNLFSLR